MVIAVTALVMSASGLAAWAAVRRWPQQHLAAPRLYPATGSRWARLRARRTDPSTATGLFLTVAGGAVVLGAAGVGLTLAMVREHAGFARLDRALAVWGRDHATPASTRFLEALTWFGSTEGVVVLVVVAAVVAHRRAPTRALVAFLALVVAGQLVVTNTVKAVVDRARPDIGPLSTFAGPSFPSGHSAAAAAGLAAAALVLGRRRPLATKAALAGGAAALATGVAASRVLLGVHWFTDVLAGLLLGWGWFALCSIAFGGRLLRFGAPAGGASDSGAPAPAAGARRATMEG